MLQSKRSLFTHYFLIAICLVSGLLTSCKDKVICPAYQSVYIHDPQVQERLFYPFDKDTLPVDYSVNVDKTRYGIMKLEPFKKKVRSLQTVEMEYVYPAPDSASGEILAYHELDSLQRDSIEAGITARKYAEAFRYNRDMKVYMEKVGQYQMAPPDEDEPEELDEFADELRDEPEEEPEQKKEGFFKRLFKGKKKRKKEEEVILEEDSGDPYESDYLKDEDENTEEEEKESTEEIGVYKTDKLY